MIAEFHKLTGQGEFGALLSALRFLGFSGDKAALRRAAAGKPGTADAAAEGNTSHDEASIEKLIADRSEARKSKNFAEADRIRKELAASGIILKDAKDPQTGELVTTWEEAR